jgi:hypothetical protein
MKCFPWLLAIPLLSGIAAGCKKNGSSDTVEKLGAFHKDVIIHEPVKYGSSEVKQQALGLYQLQDPSTMIFTASRGSEEYDAVGFRIGSITNDAVVSWIRSYYLPSSYMYQFANCSAFDNSQYTWLGGHIFGVPDSYGRPFLVKLNSDGDMVWSKYFVNAGPVATARSIAVTALKNGDIAFLTSSGNSFILYRISADGTLLWGRSIGNNLQTDPYFGSSNMFNNRNQTMVEAPDGSMYIAFASNASFNNKDVLIKVNSAGDLLFAKSYSYWSAPGAYYPHIVCTNDGRIIYGNNKKNSIPDPYFFVIAPDGSVQAAKAFPKDSAGAAVLFINELHYHNNNLFVVTCQGNQMNMYKADLSLNVSSSVKMLGTNGFGTDEGGVSLFNATNNFWYHMWNFTGMYGDGNGFQFMKTPESGASCHSYTEAPGNLVLQPVTVTVLDETGVTVQNITLPTLQTLSWQSATVATTAVETACSN